jgi:hypothetical protein
MTLLEEHVIVGCNSSFLVNFLINLRTKAWSLVRYVFCDAPSLIIDLLDKGDLAHILEHQIDAMGSAWSPNHHVVPLH